MTKDRRIDPFKHIGTASSWGTFGQGAQDEACDAERRAMLDYFLRRLAKGKRKNSDNTSELLTGGFTAFACLFIAAGGGPEMLEDDAFEKWIGIATFAWYQALSCGETTGGLQ